MAFLFLFNVLPKNSLLPKLMFLTSKKRSKKVEKRPTAPKPICCVGNKRWRDRPESKVAPIKKFPSFIWTLVVTKRWSLKKESKAPTPTHKRGPRQRAQNRARNKDQKYGIMFNGLFKSTAQKVQEQSHWIDLSLNSHFEAVSSEIYRTKVRC